MEEGWSNTKKNTKISILLMINQIGCINKIEKYANKLHVFDIVQNINKLQNLKHVHDTIRRKKLQCYFFVLRASEYLCVVTLKRIMAKKLVFLCEAQHGKKIGNQPSDLFE